MTRPRIRLFAAGLAGALVLAACSGGGGSKAAPTPGGQLPKCPMAALAKTTQPVEITFWHAMARANEETLIKLVDRFNASQAKVKVKLINQTGYKENLQKFRAGLSSGDLPEIVQIEDTAPQQMIDTRAILPVQSCVAAEKFDTSDYVPRVLNRYTVDKVLWSMPFNVSNPVLYYDKRAFRAAGLDPEKPPATLDEVKQDSQKLKDAGYEYGYGLKLDPWYLEQWSSLANVLYVNNGNGRKARATKAAFDNAIGKDAFRWMNDMVKSGLAITNSAEGPSGFDNLLGIRSKKNAMALDTSAALGTISQVLASAEGGGVELGVGPMPRPSGNGGVLVGGASLYISNRSSPEKQAAAWELAKFLTTAQNQATWAAGTGYVPIRKSSISLPAIKELWAKNPGYKVAYDQLVTGVNTLATDGPVIGDYQGVRDAVLAAEQQMFTQGKAPDAALSSAADAATQVMQEYNARVTG